MIDRFLGDAFGLFSCRFWSTVLHSGARMRIHTLIKLLDRAVSVGRFLTGGVFECDIVHRRSVAVLCMLYTRCTLLMVLYLNHMCQCGLHAVVWSHIGTLMHRLAAEPRSTALLLFLSLCPSGTILLTPYSMVWDWRVSRAGPMLFIGLSCSIPTMVLYSFSLSLLSVHRLVLWGWGLRTDRVYITLQCVSLALPIFLNNNNNNNNNNNSSFVSMSQVFFHLNAFL